MAGVMLRRVVVKGIMGVEVGAKKDRGEKRSWESLGKWRTGSVS